MNKKDNIEIAHNKERKPSLEWNRWDVVVFAILAPFVILAIFVILDLTGGISYLSGRFDVPFDFLVVCVLATLITSPLMIVITIFPFVVIGFFAVIGTVRLLISWKRYTRKKKLIRTAQIGVSIFSITLLTLFVLSLFTTITPYLGVPGYKPFTYGFRDRIRSRADVEDIRDWLKTVSKEDCIGDFGRLPYSKLSESLKALNPKYAVFCTGENGNPKVRLTWGSGFGHWGVEIGMEDMEIPPSDLSQYGEYRLPLEPGVYVWHEIQ